MKLGRRAMIHSTGLALGSASFAGLAAVEARGMFPQLGVQALARTPRSAEREPARTHPGAMALRALPREHRNPAAGQLEYLPAVRRLNLS